jgi:RNA polymerase sigma-70 factor (ECF subfamily)
LFDRSALSFGRHVRPVGWTGNGGRGHSWESMTRDASSDPPAPFDPDDLARHGKFVRSLARELVRDEDDADELTARTFEAALEQRPDGGPGLRAWLRRVVYRLSGRARREALRRRSRERSAAVPEVQPATVDVVARMEMERTIAAAFGALDERDRTVLFFRYFDDLAPRAIAARMELPVETVRTRIKRGLARLRVALDRAHGDRRDAWVGVAAALAGAGGRGALALKISLAAAVLLLVSSAWTLWRPSSKVGNGAPTTASARSLTAVAGDEGGTRELADAAGSAVRDTDAALPFASGIVVDPDGTPLPDVAVVFGELNRNDPDNVYVYRVRLDRLAESTITRTDRSGHFVVKEPSVDLAELQFVKDGFAVARWNELDRDRAKNGGVRVVMQPGHRIAGRIRDREGRPVATASITAFLPWDGGEKTPSRIASHLVDAPTYFLDPNGPQLATRPASDGTFEISFLPPAPCWVGINSWGYEMSNTSVDAKSTAPLDVVLRRRALQIDVTDAESGAPVDRPRVVAGRSDTGEVCADELPFRERCVDDLVDLLAPPNRISLSIETCRSWFSSQDLDPHPVRLHVLASGYATRTLDVALRFDEELPHLNVALTREAAAPVLSGRVHAPSRARLAVHLPPTRISREIRNGESPLVELLCDSDGRFACAGLPPATYRVDVTAPGCGARSLDIVVPATELDLSLESEAKLDVLAADSAGRGVAGVPVVAETSEDRRLAWRRITDATGHVRFDGLPAGSFLVGVFPHHSSSPFIYGVHAHDRLSFLPGSECRLEAGELTTFTISVPEARTITVHVVDGREAPIPGAQVYMYATGGSAYYQDDRHHDRIATLRKDGLVTDADGIIRAELFPSPYSGFVVAAGLRPEFEFEVAVAGTSEFTVRLPIHGERATIRGRVLELNTDAPLASCRVVWFHRAGAAGLRMQDSTFTDAGGRYEIDGVPLGDTALVAYGREDSNGIPVSHGSTSREIVLRERAPLELDFRLARIHEQDETSAPIVAQFTVLDEADGLPMRGADIWVDADVDGTKAWLGSGESTESGAVSMRLARAELYRVTVLPPWDRLHPDRKRPREVRELPAPADGVLRATFRLKRE